MHVAEAVGLVVEPGASERDRVGCALEDVGAQGVVVEKCDVDVVGAGVGQDVVECHGPIEEPVPVELRRRRRGVEGVSPAGKVVELRHVAARFGGVGMHVAVGEDLVVESGAVEPG